MAFAPRLLAGILATSGLLACTSTPVRIDSPAKGIEAASISANDAIALLPSQGAPGYPETGAIAAHLLSLALQGLGEPLPSSQVRKYLDTTGFIPAELEIEALEEAAGELGADVLVWTVVNQYTPYSWTNRLAPATPPYVELTLHVYRIGTARVVKLAGRKQGNLPATIRSRQPTFEDVAKPVMTELVASLR
jgi:hypothetical protein